jgi:aspartokinase
MKKQSVFDKHYLLRVVVYALTAVLAFGVLVYAEDLGGRKEELLRDLFENLHVRAVTMTSNMALLSVVGEGMSSQSARMILQAMEEVGAEPLLVDGGADRMGVTVGFDESYLQALVTRLYEKLSG